MVQPKTGNQRRIKVWDPWVRGFHWLLVVLLVLAWYSGEYGFSDLGKTWHMRIGMAVLALVVFRLLWGLAGSETARFRNFVRGPRAVVAYLKDAREGRPTPIGHNPLGGWSVVVLLLLVAAQPVTGLFATDDILSAGYLADDVPDGVQSAVGGLHGMLFWALLAVVGLHVAVVVAYPLIKGENLIHWMITGRRPAPADWAEPWFASPVRAALCLAVAVAVAVAIPVIWG